MKGKIRRGILILLLVNIYCFAFSDSAVFLKIKLNETTPPKVPVQIGITFFAKRHITLAKFGIRKDGKIIPFDTGFHSAFPWDKIPSILSEGGETLWIDITEEFSKKPQNKGEGRTDLKLMVISFNTPARPLEFHPRDRKVEQGNLEGVSATIKFATAPSEQKVVKSITYNTERSLIPLVIFDADKNLDVCGPKMKTLYEYTCERLEKLKKAGLKQNKLPEKIITSTWVIDGQFYSLYDKKTLLKEAEILHLMGIKYIKGWEKVPDINRNILKDQSLFFIELGHPVWVVERDKSAWNNYREKAINSLTKLQKWIKKMQFKKGEKIIVKVGDEPKILQKKDILKAPNGIEKFRIWLKEKGVSPEDVGFSGYSEIEPLFDWQKAKGDEKKARLYYFTICFQQELTAWMWSEYRNAVRQILGENAFVGTCVPYNGFDSTPDYFLFSRLGVWDIHMHHYTTGLWVPIHHILFLGNLLKSSAKFGQSQMGGLWAIGRIGSTTGTELTGMSGLIRGMRFFYLYDYGPAITQWGKMSDNFEQCITVSKIFKYASEVENFIVEGKSPKSEVALLSSRGSEIWFSPPRITEDIMYKGPRGLIVEKHILNLALSLNQIPVDILPDEEIPERLDNYKVLYITDPHISDKKEGSFL